MVSRFIKCFVFEFLLEYLTYSLGKNIRFEVRVYIFVFDSKKIIYIYINPAKKTETR